jgi:hypothetical protein
MSDSPSTSDGLKQSAMPEDDELSSKDLTTSTEILSPDSLDPGTVKNIQVVEHLSYGQGQNGTDSKSKEDGEHWGRAFPFAGIISSHFESNGGADILVMPPDLHLHLQNGGDLLSKQRIEESDSELIVSENPFPREESV